LLSLRAAQLLDLIAIEETCDFDEMLSEIRRDVLISGYLFIEELVIG
jgi:hypothetical protein